MIEWMRKSELLPEVKGTYLVVSNYGVRCAFFDPEWSRKFQDCATNNDEGMSDWESDEPYRVTHWMKMPEAPGVN